MALFQAYLVQGTAWRSVTLQDVRQNRRLPRAWVLNSVAKFVYCVQTLEGRLDEAEIAANFGLQKRCQG